MQSLQEKQSELAVFLARDFKDWFQERLDATTDGEFRRVLTFVKTMRIYKLFRSAMRSGDAIVIEALYVQFMPYWIAASKPNCFENALHQLDELYVREDTVPSAAASKNQSNASVVRRNQQSPQRYG